MGRDKESRCGRKPIKKPPNPEYHIDGHEHGTRQGSAFAVKKDTHSSVWSSRVLNVVAFSPNAQLRRKGKKMGKERDRHRALPKLISVSGTRSH